MKMWIRAFLAAAMLVGATLAQALSIEPFSAAALKAAQDAGKPVAVHFHADWCPTCRKQEQSFLQLKTESGLDVLVLVANYDNEKELRKAMNVRTQSTLIVFRGFEEKARLAGDTAADKLRAALKSAL